MPAPSTWDLRRDHQGFVEEKSHSHHRFLARFLDKREMAKASCFESSVNKGAAPNPKNPSPTRQYSNSTQPKNPKNPSPTRHYSNSSQPKNPKTPSPTRQDSGSTQPKNPKSPTRQDPGSTQPKNPKSPTRQDSNSTQPKSKATVNPIPRPRIPGAKSMAAEKPTSELSAPPLPRREYQKSPLTSLLRKNQVKGNEVNRLLVTVNVLGSAGPLRFLVSCDDPVQKVIEIALKSYAREGRLPVLGQNIKEFELYTANSGCGEALDASETVGNLGIRNFLLCKKHRNKLQEEEKHMSTSNHHHQKSNAWKNWLLTMSTSFGISSH